MGTLNIGLTDSGVANGSRSYNLTDPVATKLIAWKRVQSPVTPDNRTDGQVLALVFDDLIAGLAATLKKVDSDVAHAAVSVPDVVIAAN